MPIADSVKLGENVKVFHPSLVNLYGCTVGDDTKIGAFVEIQKGAAIGARCKISSHTFICEGVVIEDEVFVGHGVMFTNDRFPRATNADGSLQTEADWKVEADAREARRIDRHERDHHFRRHDRRRRAGRSRRSRDQGCPRLRDRGRRARARRRRFESAPLSAPVRRVVPSSRFSHAIPGITDRDPRMVAVITASGSKTQ